MTRAQLTIDKVKYDILDLKCYDPKKVANDAVAAFVIQLDHLPPPEKKHQLEMSVLMQIKRKFAAEVAEYQYMFYETRAALGTKSMGCDKNTVVVWVTKRSAPQYTKKNNRELELGFKSR